MADQTGNPGQLGARRGASAGIVASVAMVAGTPVYINADGELAPANADDVSTAFVIGILQFAVQPNERAPILSTGQSLEQAAPLWDAIAGTSGGLVPGTPYFLKTTDGELTDTPTTTSNQFQTLVGVAESPTSLLLLLGQPYKNLPA